MKRNSESTVAIGTFEAARICHVTPATINNWIKVGKLKPSFKTAGGQNRFFRTDLGPFLKSLNLKPPQNYPPKSPSVLIVEDDLMTRRLFTRWIKKYAPELEVFEAKNGYEAGYKTKSIKPSLVILDIRLPGIDGYQVCRTIKKEPCLKGTKILAVTAYDFEKSKKLILKSGADEFLEKPIDSDIFLEKLKTLLPQPQLLKASAL